MTAAIPDERQGDVRAVPCADAALRRPRGGRPHDPVAGAAGGVVRDGSGAHRRRRPDGPQRLTATRSRARRGAAGRSGLGVEETQRGVDEAEVLGRGEVVDAAERRRRRRRAGPRPAGRRGRRSRGRRAPPAPGHVTLPRMAASRRGRGWRMQAARATRSTPGCAGEAGEVLHHRVGRVAASPSIARAMGSEPSSRNRFAPTPATTTRANRSGSSAASVRTIRAPSEKPIASTGRSGRWAARWLSMAR